VVIIDEIGKMELLSDRFQQVLESALKSHKPLLGTVMQGKNRLTDELKDRPDVSVFHVNEETRSYLVNEIILRLNSIIGNGHGSNGNNGSGNGTN
jgi:nucleoside-triphosphatase